MTWLDIALVGLGMMGWMLAIAVGETIISRIKGGKR